MRELLFFTLALFLFSCGSSDKNAEIDKKVNKLVSEMTLEEKVGQMTQIAINIVSVGEYKNIKEPHQIDTAKLRIAIAKYGVGSILNVANNAATREHWLEIMTTIKKMTDETRLKIPVLYGIDAIHGVTYTVGSTLFPQQIAMAATWNPELITKAGEISAYETRASYIPWNFSPVLDLGRRQTWSRLWETFGEDVFLARTMGSAIIKGYQGNDISDKYHVASCMKHYMGYSFPLSGKDRTPAWIPENYLLEYFSPTFRDAILAGSPTVMVNSAEINGTPVHANYHILTEILRGDLQFKGFVVSDWADIKMLNTIHHVASTQKEAVKMAVMAGIDMSMVPDDYSFADTLIALVNDGSVPMKRIDEAVKRILKVKFQTGLFDNMFYKPEDYPNFGSEEYRKINKSAADECITLLKNNGNILPLPKTAKVLVTGFAANSMRCLNGGWSYTWQGDKSESFAANYNTILEAVQQKIGAEKVTYMEGVSFDADINMESVVNAAKGADYVVLCLGENTYAETPGNIDDLSMPYIQGEFARQLAKTGKPIILVLAEGRPRLINKFDDGMSAILMSYLSGNEGGNAIADILFGDVNPSGKLPFTYPKYPNSLENYDCKNADIENGRFTPQYPFGFGLSYTKFAYSDLKLSQSTISMKDSLTISVTVTNKGKREGKEVVQLYISDLYASITPPVSRLRGFEKIDLKPTESKTVTFKISPNDLAFVDAKNKWITEAGDFTVKIENQTANFLVK